MRRFPPATGFRPTKNSAAIGDPPRAKGRSDGLVYRFIDFQGYAYVCLSVLAAPCSTSQAMEDKMSSPYALELTRSCENCRLRSEGFFCQFSKRVLQVFDSIKYITAYPGGAVLFVEEEPPRGVFVLCQGRVKLSMSSSEGKMVTLRTAKPGDVLGLHAVVSGKPYEATAETLGP